MRAKEVGGGGERKRALKKARRNLDKVLQDEERLRRMAGMQEKAQMLQNNLYRLPYTEKVSRVRVQDAVGNARELDLDPEVSILDNMNRWFRQARKGRRGLEVQARRRQGLEREVERLENEAAVPPEPAGTVEPGPAAQARRGGRHRWQGMNVHVFRSSDGFTIVRGRDRKANHRLLSQAAKPFDLWFHAQDGPGAHVVLRRDHEEQEVPRRSMEEAAVIAGLASHYSMADKARVLCALVRNVRKIKGAALGQVQVGKVRESLNVELDQALESRLRQSSSQSGQRTETTGG
jgi:predicted ribosome quality control (RQC) complex YloA/Tae2 family protein